MDIGKTISERRHQLRITQNDLAEMAEVSIATVKDIERGKGNPSISTLGKICTVLELVMKLELKKDEI
ncbi:MAG TPA: helix-turn-helix transcriptional regulator [Paludibacteraceae bacterium]|nr:helix-turn-helix transcriptional regulator [Paludibacteraceae bacterium]HPH63125.1 helix-turn-helix transcriptional regulator [Paludibacteraceae bacterium]